MELLPQIRRAKRHRVGGFERLEARQLLAANLGIDVASLAFSLPLGDSHVVLGDLDGNDRFDAVDLSHALVGGRYEAHDAVDVVWSQGDWNGDKRFDSADFVKAFAEGKFQGNARAADAAATSVVISEIMYHAPNNDSREEFVELWNRGAGAVQLADWQFANGIQFRFPEYLLLPDQRVVVAANRDTFLLRYPDVVVVLGDWQGGLSNRGETLELVDATGRTVDRVRYADQGEWAVRVQDQLDHGHQGWTWWADHDGRGASLELINGAVATDFGQNWQASRVAGGTPGRANSVARDDTAPLIFDISQQPLLPTSQDAVQVLARIQDDHGTTSVVTLEYRIDGFSESYALRMRDDGRAPTVWPATDFLWGRFPLNRTARSSRFTSMRPTPRAGHVSGRLPNRPT